MPLWSRISNSGSLKDQFTSEVNTSIEKRMGSYLNIWSYLTGQLLLRMHTMFYTAGSTIARKGETANSLAIIVSGKVKIFLPGRTGQQLLTLGPGCASMTWTSSNTQFHFQNVAEHLICWYVVFRLWDSIKVPQDASRLQGFSWGQLDSRWS